MSAPIVDLLPLWRASLKSAGKSSRTIRSYVDSVSAYAVRLGPGATLAQVSRKSIASYQDAIGATRSAKTVALHLTAIRAFCRWCIDSELREDDPTARIVWPKVGARLPGRALTRAQVTALLTAIRVPPGLPPAEDYQRRRNRLAVLLMLYCGARLSETAALRWRDVDLEAGMLTIRGGKGDKDRSVPIHRELVGTLRLAAAESDPSAAVVGKRDGSALSGKSLAHLFERYLPSLGLSFHVSAHMLRHTFCTGLIRAGVPLADAQALMGHESPVTTQRYYALTAEHLRGSIDRLPAW